LFFALLWSAANIFGARERKRKLEMFTLPFFKTALAARLLPATLQTYSNGHVFLLPVTKTKGAGRFFDGVALHGEAVFFSHNEHVSAACT